MNSNSKNTQSNKTWSNFTGYGNISVFNNSNDNIVTAPWNRIPQLSLPTSTTIDKSIAWSSNNIFNKNNNKNNNNNNNKNNNNNNNNKNNNNKNNKL